MPRRAAGRWRLRVLAVGWFGDARPASGRFLGFLLDFGGFGRGDGWEEAWDEGLGDDGGRLGVILGGMPGVDWS